MVSYSEVLTFWFGDLRDKNDYPQTKAPLWFKKSQQTDDLIRERFAATITALERTEAKDWSENASTRLAAIIVLDQFTRNIFRGSPLAFACDPLALELARAGIALGQDQELALVQRVFFYLPLEHAESLALQEQSVAAFAQMVTEANISFRPHALDFHNYAIRHRDVIARFGRFPHRNAILGRESTEEELVYLSLPGSGF